jgi:Zn-dependent membrane protease YugP
MFGLFFGDWTILIVIPGALFAFWAQYKVQSTFTKYSRDITRRRITGYDAARRILDANGLSDVKIEKIPGQLTDHYDPRANVIRLSDSTYANPSAAAVGVAAHEAGHAIQHAKGYLPIKIRSAIIPVTQLGSRLAMPLFLIGLLFASDYLMLAGIVLFSTVALFQLVTLPTEFDASRRALRTLSTSGMLCDDEIRSASRVLGAAAMTYVAALATSLLTILRLILLAGGRRRN